MPLNSASNLTNVVSSSNLNNTKEDCSICITPFTSNNRAVSTSCDIKPHHFHLECIKTWFNSLEQQDIHQRTCCICRSIAVPLTNSTGQLLYDPILLEDMELLKRCLDNQPSLANAPFLETSSDCYIFLLLAAVLNDNQKAVELLLDKNSDIDRRLNEKSYYYHNWTPLIIAIRERYQGIASLLINRGADVNARVPDEGESKGLTPLMMAVIDMNIPILEELLSHHKIEVNSVQINAGLNSGKTALMWACENGNKTIVSCLLSKKGALINVSQKNAGSNNGKTALMWAAEKGAVDVVELLIYLKVDISTQQVDAGDNTGKTALMWALQNGHRDVINCLLKNGAH